MKKYITVKFYYTPLHETHQFILHIFLNKNNEAVWKVKIELCPVNAEGSNILWISLIFLYKSIIAIVQGSGSYIIKSKNHIFWLLYFFLQAKARLILIVYVRITPRPWIVCSLNDPSIHLFMFVHILYIYIASTFRNWRTKCHFTAIQ